MTAVKMKVFLVLSALVLLSSELFIRCYVNAPKKAATCYFVLMILGFFICFPTPFRSSFINISVYERPLTLLLKCHGPPRVIRSVDGRNKITRSICTWCKRGHLSLGLPTKCDLTIYMDIEGCPILRHNEIHGTSQ